MKDTFELKISSKFFKNLAARIGHWKPEYFLLAISLILAAAATYVAYQNNSIVSYGDAESHLNISKRVIHSLTPGFAQLGGIWLPIPHILMIPFVSIDFLWRTGLAGSIVSGIAYIISVIYLYKLGYLVFKNKTGAIVSALVFATNPNILYLQATPMTEIPLIMFFILSSYYFIKFIFDDRNIIPLLLAAFFGFCATLSRYDGWFLVMIQAGALFLLYYPLSWPKNFSDIKKLWNRDRWNKTEGIIILFGTLAFAGIAVWLMWDWIILGDPLYFTHSQFSAKSQQQNWLIRGELPAYENIWESVVYYTVTSMSNIGIFSFALALVGLTVYALDKHNKRRWLVLLILMVPFIFNVTTLFLGQSVIFIPHITPDTFEWRLFNVRYGVMMVPTAAFVIGYLFWRFKWQARFLISILLLAQVGLYVIGYSKVVSYQDGTAGLSSASAKIPDAQYWIRDNYDDGLVLVDDFARTLSIVRTNIPMQNMIYVGNKPYWEDSLEEPEKYATWIIMQNNDEVWRNLLDGAETEGRLYKYFQKVYTSPEILIFKRNEAVSLN